jgi:hypothetical protein
MIRRCLCAACAVALFTAYSAFAQAGDTATSIDNSAQSSASVEPTGHLTDSATAKSNSAAKPHSVAPPSTPAAHATSHTGKSKQANVRSGRRSSRRRVARGQQKIDPERAEQIQQALIREHYLSGQPSGTWNQASEDAMRRYQADHGWQSKTVPDSRALISLGLGPNHDHLLNPESAMTTEPKTLRAGNPPAAASIPAASSSNPGAKAQPDSVAPSPARLNDPPQPQK